MDQAPVPPGILDLSIRRWGGVVELDLVGDVDSATVHRLGEAVTWLRHSTADARIVVIDTTAVTFVSGAGYRALHAALAAWDDRPRTRVVSVAGAAFERIEAAVAAIAAARGRPPARPALRRRQPRGRGSRPTARPPARTPTSPPATALPAMCAAPRSATVARPGSGTR